MALTMMARPSAEMLTSGIHGFDLNRGASTGRRRAMLVILALIILVIFDMWTLHEMRKHEIAIIELLKKNGMITRRDTDDD